MSINILLDPGQEPTDQLLRSTLGPTWPHFEALRSLTASCEQEWRHYGKKYGWKFKIHADDKTLAELTVAGDWFLVAMAIREKERQALAADPAARKLVALESGVAAKEGWGIRIEVRDDDTFERARALIAFAMKFREL